MNTITITRPYNGIGDHLFALACIKYTNRQRPDIQVFADLDHVRFGELPPIVRSLYAASDCRFTFGRGPREDPWTHDSLVYRKWPPELFIESTVLHLNEQTGLDIRYEHGVYPDFGVPLESRGNYVVINAGKKRQRVGKHYGHANFNELARLLRARGYEVVQIGSTRDLKLPTANVHVMGASADTLLPWMAGARACITIENGLMVLAGFMGQRQFTVYDGNGLPTRVDFENQVKLIERMEPAQVCERVVEVLDGPWQQEIAC